MADKKFLGHKVLIRNRWKTAFKSVTKIGFRPFEELIKREDRDCNEIPTVSCNNTGKYNNNIQRRHEFIELQKPDCDESICCVCIENFDPEDSVCIIKCQTCKLVAHIDCQHNLVQTSCSPNKTPKFYVDNSQDSWTDELNSPRSSSSALDWRKASSLDTSEIDPIYLALKRGNKMANMRRTSFVEPIKQSTSKTRLTGSSTGDTTRLSKTNLHGKGNVSYQAKKIFGSVQENRIDNESLNKSDASQSAVSPGSAPNLLNEKTSGSNNGAESSSTSRKLSGAQKQLAKRAPKLDLKMKSLSLDCSDATIKKKVGAPGALAPNRHAFRVPPCKYDSVESDDTGNSSSVSGTSVCPTSTCSSSLTLLPSNAYAVTHDYYAKFPEEIDLRVGERVLLIDNGDQDWWQGHNITGRLGIFPSTCVAHIHCNEKVMQVVQNVCLWVGNKNTRLYRDQIVFAQMDEIIDGTLLTVRTERDHRINCPLRYLMSLE